MFNTLSQAFESVRSNLLRASVTMFIIALGITSLVGVLTSIDGIKYWMANSFSSLGTNTFRILDYGSGVRMGGGGRGKRKAYPNITYTEAQIFQERFEGKGIVCLTGTGNFAATLKYESDATNPNVQIIGTDQNYLKVYKYAVSEGRNFSEDELFSGDKVIIIGEDLRKRLYPHRSPLGTRINADNHIYKVVGVLAEVGSS